jgi:hypothetical protein
VGSAASLIAAALVSLLFATGLVAFTSWPAAGGGSPVTSVSLPPSAPAGGVPTGAAGRASAAGVVVLAAPAAAPARRGAARTVARTGGRGGSTTAGAPATATTPTGSSSPGSGSQGSDGGPSAPSVTRQVTDGLADTTSSTTHQVGSAVGGPAGDAIGATGDQVAETVRDVGTAAQPLLGALGG